MPLSLGQKLKQAREQQGLSLADVSHKTRIPVPRLQDLEDDNYNTFGSLTYARSFLLSYAAFVGVDANSVADHMNPTPLGGASEYRYLTESLGRWIGVKSDRSLMPDARPVRSSSASAVVIVVVGLVLVGGVLLAKSYLNEHKTPVAENRPLPRIELPRANSGDTEEIRPASPNRPVVTENVPVRKALPVEDDPKPKAKR